MTAFTLNIADQDIVRVTAALSVGGGFAEVSEANAMAAVMAWIKQTVANVEMDVARQAALNAVIAPVPVSLS